MVQFPQIKRTVKKFILNEDGRISKSNLIKIGIMTAAAIGFLTQKKVAGHASSHANTLSNHASGHNDGLEDYGEHDSLLSGTARDSAHASAHCSWSHSSGSSWGLTGIRNRYAHKNNLSIQPQGSCVQGQHNHEVTHASTKGVHRACDVRDRPCTDGHKYATYIGGILYDYDDSC